MSHEFKWKEEYSVHVEEIDNQHKRLVELIFKLFESLNKQQKDDNLGEILSKLIEYSGYHFATEEGYFKKFNYEHAEEHIEEHKKFDEKMKTLQKQYSDNEIEISFELIDYLEDWLIDHLIETDQKYVKCFQENGLK